MCNRNIVNIKQLWILLIFRVFATHFEVGDFHASFERHFVKKIQHLFSFHAACCQYYSSCFLAVIWCWNFVLQCKSSEQPLCSFVSEIWNNNGKVDQSFFERFEQNGLTINRFSADCGSCSEEIVEKIEKHCKSFYIRANRCSSIYNDIFALKGWKTEEINGIEFDWTLSLLRSGKVRHIDLLFKDLT